jgi:uncharacterized radical SAM superfamily Fe-S cluster-containing enzyme
MNKSFCNSCHELVPAERAERDGKIYLVKTCPKCGETDTLISSNAERYNNKRGLDTGYNYHGCSLKCETCRHTGRAPSFAFVDVTNRCNMNCPICCDNVPSMGFQFDPPLEYFDKLFAKLAQQDPMPTVALFGGEPTAREDLFDIVELSRSYGLTTRVVTNGLKMADKEYCDALLATRARVLLSYDGSNPETYIKLRGTDSAMKPKQQAIENIANSPHVRRGRVMLISCIARGINDHELPDLLDFYHSKRSFLSCVHLMPLAHTWESYNTDFEPERITTEDVEDIVEGAFPGQQVEFLPAGFLAQFSTISEVMGTSKMPFLGAHPNCESVAMLVSDGKKYVPVSHFLKKPLTEIAHELIDLEKKMGGDGADTGEPRPGALTFLRTALFLARRMRLSRILKGRGPGKIYHALAFNLGLLFGRKRQDLVRKHLAAEGVLQLIILPFEDNYVIETERLERCPNMHVYLNPKTEEVGHVPVCAWRLYNRQVMSEIAQHYETAAATADQAG